MCVCPGREVRGFCIFGETSSNSYSAKPFQPVTFWPAYTLRWPPAAPARACSPLVPTLMYWQPGRLVCFLPRQQQSQPAGLSQQVSAPGKTIHVSCRVSGGSTHIAARQALLWGTPERPVFRRSALMMLWRWFSACTDCVAFIRSILA